MNPSDNATVTSEPKVETGPPLVVPQPVADQPAPSSDPQPVKITVLEGQKVLFDEKVGLVPVQVVEKQERMNGSNGGSGNGHVRR